MVQRTGLRLRLCTLVFAGALLSGCASGLPEPTAVAFDEPPPDFRALIAKNLATKQNPPNPRVANTDSAFFIARAAIFSESKKIEQVSISDSSRKVQTMMQGQAWQTCMRLSVDGAPFTLAVFAAGNRIIDARSAILADECGAGNYIPLNVTRPKLGG